MISLTFQEVSVEFQRVSGLFQRAQESLRLIPDGLEGVSGCIRGGLTGLQSGSMGVQEERVPGDLRTFSGGRRGYMHVSGIVSSKKLFGQSCLFWERQLCSSNIFLDIQKIELKNIFLRFYNIHRGKMGQDVSIEYETSL